MSKTPSSIYNSKSETNWTKVLRGLMKTMRAPLQEDGTYPKNVDKSRYNFSLLLVLHGWHYTKKPFVTQPILFSVTIDLIVLNDWDYITSKQGSDSQPSSLAGKYSWISSFGFWPLIRQNPLFVLPLPHTHLFRWFSYQQIGLLWFNSGLQMLQFFWWSWSAMSHVHWGNKYFLRSRLLQLESSDLELRSGHSKGCTL